MQVITAVETLMGPDQPTVFLAGGITKCPDWQQTVIDKLADVDDGVLLNPRRPNFPINDPNASREQITWEFNALARAHVFAMWFSNSDSDQPICMYELGRHLAIRELTNDMEHVLIGVEPGYRRLRDVYIQVGLVCPKLAGQIVDNLDDHAENIRRAVSDLCDQGLESIW